MNNVPAFVLGVFMGAVLAAIIVGVVAASVWRAEALDAGVARYNDKTGDFEFIEAKEK